MTIRRPLLLFFFLQRSTLAFFLQNIAKASKAVSLISDLEGLIQKSETIASPEIEGEIKSLMIGISESRLGDQRPSLPGRWKLIFTTEKEINFFKTSWPFAKVSSITQDIDPYGSCAVNNVISFEGGGEFAVTGSVAPAEGLGEYDRIEFRFQEAVIRGWGRELKVPPVGSGWFETMFCDGKYRLSRDSRGDWSVFRKIE
jgi:PAP_fibrillin